MFKTPDNYYVFSKCKSSIANKEMQNFYEIGTKSLTSKDQIVSLWKNQQAPFPPPVSQYCDISGDHLVVIYDSNYNQLAIDAGAEQTDGVRNLLKNVLTPNSTVFDVGNEDNIDRLREIIISTYKKNPARYASNKKTVYGTFQNPDNKLLLVKCTSADSFDQLRKKYADFNEKNNLKTTNTVVSNWNANEYFSEITNSCKIIKTPKGKEIIVKSSMASSLVLNATIGMQPSESQSFVAAGEKLLNPNYDISNDFKESTIVGIIDIMSEAFDLNPVGYTGI